MTQEEANKRALLAMLAAADAGDLEKTLSFYSPAYMDHDASEARAGDCPLASLRQAFVLFHAAFTGTRHVVDMILAEDDLVAARIRVQAMHTADLYGVTATGARVCNDSIVIYRFEAGRILERWCRERQSTRKLLEGVANVARIRTGEPLG